MEYKYKLGDKVRINKTTGFTEIAGLSIDSVVANNRRLIVDQNGIDRLYTINQAEASRAGTEGPWYGIAASYVWHENDLDPEHKPLEIYSSDQDLEV